MAVLVGCADDPPPYEHAVLSLQSPQARQVRALLGRLRQSARDGVDQIAPEGHADQLPEDQARMLRFALRQLAEADSVELVSLEHFGPKFLQAGFKTTTKGKTAVRRLLLLQAEGAPLRWARPN